MTATVADTPSPFLSSTSWAERVRTLDYPTKRDEAWRYAPLVELGRLSFGSDEVSAGQAVADVASRIPALDGPRIVIVNGIVDHDRSNVDGFDGLVVSTLADAMTANPDLVASHFGAEDDEVADAFVALNLAFGRDGAVVQVADGHDLAAPIHIVDIVVPGDEQNASNTGVVIVVGQDSSATVLETRLGGGADFGGSNVRTTITLGEDANLDHIVLQDLPPMQIHLSRVEVTQGARLSLIHI